MRWPSQFSVYDRSISRTKPSVMLLISKLMSFPLLAPLAGSLLARCTLTNNDWLDTRQIQPTIRNFRNCSSQHFHAKARKHLLGTITTAHSRRLSVPCESVVCLLVHLALPQRVLEAVPERVKDLGGISDALCAQVSATH